jgi:hypothetical protein
MVVAVYDELPRIGEMKNRAARSPPDKGGDGR